MNELDLIEASPDDIHEIERIRNLFLDTIELNDLRYNLTLAAMMNIITNICIHSDISEEKIIEMFKQNFRQFSKQWESKPTKGT